MNKHRARVADGRVFEIRDIEATTRYLHPDYHYEVGDGVLSETGRVVVFELNPKNSSLPSFTARWDGGNRAAPNKIRYDLDIDIRGVSSAEERRFKNGQVGYGGHHTKQVNHKNKYDIHLTAPFGLVFDASISFSRHHALELGASVQGIGTVTLSTPKAGILPKLRSTISAIMAYIAV